MDKLHKTSQGGPIGLADSLELLRLTMGEFWDGRSARASGVVPGGLMQIDLMPTHDKLTILGGRCGQ